MNSVTVKKHKQIIPTYIPKKANDLPMFFENKPYQGASGRLYPIPYSDGITDEKKDVEYDVFTLENEYIKTQILPEAGGKILRGYDKCGEHDFIYYNEVIKPALVGLAGAWISGGIEFNWPQHHRPTTFMPLEAVIEKNPDGSKTVWTGEVEPFNRMKGMAGITLDRGRSYIKAKVRVYNRTPFPQVFMWWANLAVPVNDNYRTVFPPDCEWVNDHDRRAVLEWPIAKGVYKTARPYDFGEGTDLSHYSAVKVPSSYLISQGQSDMDFIAGYDTGIGKGIATVANHHISPGKKMWHWGIGEFGDMWCNNLTDSNGPYIELMTGVYTDNQPDFTWIAPYESREFEQYWYPIRDIGEIKNASIDAAVNLEKRDNGIYFGFNVTGEFKKVCVLVTAGEKTLFTELCDMSPEKSYIKTLDKIDCNFNDVTVSLINSDGKTLVSYTPYIRGQKKPIEPRLPVKRPSEIATVEELYINGYHLEQYKQHNYKPEDYYLEGLKRDEFDTRCNTSMARLCLKNGKFEECIFYCDRASKRLTMRNEHPTDTEAFYLKGLALVYLGKDKEAYDILYKAAWNYTHRSAALFELACLDCKNKDYAAALEKLDESLGLNHGHTKAQNLKCAVMRRINPSVAKKFAVENEATDKLDLFAKIELSHFTDNSSDIEQFTKKAENLIDVACDYIKAGFYDDAIYALDFFEGEYPLADYYRAWCSRDISYLKKAESLDSGYCFPSRLEDIAVLNYAIENNPDASQACYYLGCLYYDRFRYDEAASVWNKGLSSNPEHGKILRNLALYYFDKADSPEKARSCLETAMKHKNDPRLLLEYEQLLKNMNYSPEERLAVYEKYPDLLAQRDDCYLDKLTLVSQIGDFEKAIEMARVKRFHIYEGGEGKLTKQHAWIHTLYGKELMEKEEYEKAEKILFDGVNMPKSYGEAKTFFNQEAHIYYYLGVLYEKTGRVAEAEEQFKKASVYKAAVSEISLFRALALQKLGNTEEANKVLDEMLSVSENFIVNKDLRTYYGVGSPSPMPFEYNIEKNNLTDGYILLGFALLGYGKKSEAMVAVKKARELSAHDFRIFAFDRICND
jgi:tetratricopeptide (TPR) repeat protein